MKNSEAYYLGLDIGTDSIGYAVTDHHYALKKFGGEPMWGTTLFNAASTSADRRLYRTGRRRVDRRQQRMRLLEDLFAAEIVKIDPHFFIRRKSSALFREDTLYGVQLFSGTGLSDTEYHKRYPTIHHLIVDLMSSDTAHDIRLVYIACAWLLANRGHSLFDIAPENIHEIINFAKVYEEFCTFLQEQDYVLPWSSDIVPTRIEDVLRTECGIKKKSELLKSEIFGRKKISKEPTDTFPFNTEAVVSLLAGSKVKPAVVFCNKAYSEIDAVSLTMNDDVFSCIVSELGDDGEFLEQLRKIVNCAQLNAAMRGFDSISEAKVRIYEQHRCDLRYLKQFVKKYCKEKYNEIFRDAVQDNYLCYSHNIKSLRGADSSKLKFSGKDEFCDFLTKRLKGISVSDTDKPAYEDMMLRLQLRTFLPKQKDADNRVIPQQLYRYELKAILDNAQTYLPMLREKDADGIAIYDKILSIFDFRVPYFVGPLKAGGKNAWIARKAEGTILPWNFADKVDLDKSEKAFIARMTNRCTYLPNEDVLPEASLLYSRFCVLNELNNLKINGTPIPVNVKQGLYTELFEQRARVTVHQIQAYLVRRGCMDDKDTLSGLDESVKSSLKPYHVFRRLLADGVLSEDDVESIIQHMAYSEDKTRMRKWLCAHYLTLQDSDISYILHQNFKGFGRLSRRFLTGIYGTAQDSDGEAYSIMELLWCTNENLMQLLSSRYTFSDTICEISRAYYAAHPKSLDERLNEMYVSNAVKRPIFRTLDIVQDVVKATGRPPEKIFIEMARGGTAEQKGKRTESRKNQLLALYKKIKTDDARRFTEELEVMFVPINLMDTGQFATDAGYAKRRTAETIERITGTQPQEMEILLGGRKLKIDTVFSFDGIRMTLASKYDEDYNVFNSLSPLVLNKDQERHVKALEVLQRKRKNGSTIVPDEKHDGISVEKNLTLYEELLKKLERSPYCKLPKNPSRLLAEKEARDKFESATILDQIDCLLSLIAWMNGKSYSCDLSSIGKSKTAERMIISNKLSALAKKYSNIRIIDYSPAGLFSTQSDNLLELL